MSNWTSITLANLAASKIGSLLETATGAGFEAEEAIADVVARIRSAVNAGNSLDVDPTKIPHSLKTVAQRMIHLQVKDFLVMPLSEVEKMLAADDSSYLRRIIDEKLKFETPDTEAGNAEMQKPSGIQISSCPERKMNRESLGGLT